MLLNIAVILGFSAAFGRLIPAIILYPALIAITVILASLQLLFKITLVEFMGVIPAVVFVTVIVIALCFLYREHEKQFGMDELLRNTLCIIIFSYSIVCWVTLNEEGYYLMDDIPNTSYHTSYKLWNGTTIESYEGEYEVLEYNARVFKTLEEAQKDEKRFYDGYTIDGFKKGDSIVVVKTSDDGKCCYIRRVITSDDISRLERLEKDKKADSRKINRVKDELRSVMWRTPEGWTAKRKLRLETSTTNGFLHLLNLSDPNKEKY